VAFGPFDELLEHLRLNPIRPDPDPGPGTQRARRHIVIHHKDRSVIGLAVDDNFDPLQCYPELSGAHHDQRCVTTCLAGAQQPAMRRRRRLASDAGGHVGVDTRTVRTVDPTAEPSLDHRQRGGIGVTGLFWVLGKILPGSLDGLPMWLLAVMSGAFLRCHRLLVIREHRPAPCHDRGVRRRILKREQEIATLAAAAHLQHFDLSPHQV
jgi:hypothetical protein